MKIININSKIVNSKFDFTRKLKYFLIAPIVLTLVGLVLFFTLGFNLGIDFTGGTILNVVVGDSLEDNAVYQASTKKIDDVLNIYGIKASMYQLNETDNGLAISVRYQDKKGYNEDEMNVLNREIKDSLYEKFGFDADNEEFAHVQDGQRIGATASSELLTNAFLALLVVIVAILIYIAIRFEFTSGMAAIFALFHDVIIMAVMVLIFRIEINSSFIAALITIVGYSINNTILVFDRIREYLSQEVYINENNHTVANKAIKDTLTRSIYTTFTTFITILMVAILGASSIQQFALPIIFGLMAGAYSSVFLAPGLWAMAYNGKRKIKKPKKEKTETENEI